jgi:hypothetical protein
VPNARRKAQAAGAAAPSSNPDSYLVREGERLPDIAIRLYGTLWRWRELQLYNQDQLINPEKICAGMVLRLPPGPRAVPLPAPAPAPAPAAAQRPAAPEKAVAVPAPRRRRSISG